VDNQSFNWYAIIESSVTLQQGDILFNFPILIPNSQIIDDSPKNKDIEIDKEKSDVVVLSQSCDLEKNSGQDLIVLCPAYDFKDSPLLNKKSNWEPLVKNRYLNIFMLNKCEIKNHEFDYKFVDLKKVITSPCDFVKEFSKKGEYRLRLLPPYREALSLAFGMQFMRVGLPIPLPRDYPL